MYIANFFLGLIVVALGATGIRFNHQIVNAFGRNNIFERKLGPGSTYAVYQLFAILVIIFGFLMMTSFHDNLLSWMFSPVTNIFQR